MTNAERVRKYDIRQTGRRLVEQPDWELIERKFDGDLDRYFDCVVANFGDVQVSEQVAA